MESKWVPSFRKRSNIELTSTIQSRGHPRLFTCAPQCVNDTIIINLSPQSGACGCTAESPFSSDCTRVNLVMVPVQKRYENMLLKVFYTFSIHEPIEGTTTDSKSASGNEPISRGRESAKPPDANRPTLGLRLRDVMKIKEHFENCFANIEMGLNSSISHENIYFMPSATSTVKVKSAIRIGKLMCFSPVDGRQLEHLNPLCVELMQRELLREKVLKERLWKHRETDLPEAVFTEILTIAEREASMRFRMKESYTIQVVDSAQDGEGFRIHCWPISHQHNGVVSHKLQIYKVYGRPCRHMTLDTGRLGRNCDFRLAVWSERSYHRDGIVWHDLQSFVGAAILDPFVKGGVRWPPDAVCQWNDRFTLISVRRSFEGWKFFGKGLTWRLKRVDGLYVERNSSSLSMEADIRSWAWKKSIQDLNLWKDGGRAGRQEDEPSIVKENWNKSSLFDSLPNVLEWIYTNLP